MELTVKERLALWNQCRILELLDKSEGDYYGRMAEALKSGYASEYEDLIYQFSDGLTPTQCRFVQKVMNMFEGLQASREALTDKSAVPESSVTYNGFDGNNETEYMGYSVFLVEQKRKWTYLKTNRDHNAHMPSVALYQGMLERWKETKDSYKLTAEQIKTIVGR